MVDQRQLGVPASDNGGGSILRGVYDILASIDLVNKDKRQAFLASFDNMKAYDRSSTVYFEKVTERMAFPPLYRSWLKMLHCDATTKLLLPSGLSREIAVSFSFRQGDNIAGHLFCLTQEPLLRMLRNRLVGLLNTNFFQKDTSYFDDIAVLSGDERDLITFETVMKRFEAQSGAMLSRDKKSKIMGLGAWQGREDWPQEVSWIKSVKVMKVLGFQVCPQYSDTLSQTWDKVLRGFQRTLYAWESRALITLQQRVTVLQTFALSKLWYTAQVLPLPTTVLKKLESASSSFIFRGHHERLKQSEIQNTVECGGLGLMCVATKAECLLLRQSLRIIQRSDQNCFRHLGHWIGNSLTDAFPALAEIGPMCRSLHSQHPLHRAMLKALQEGLLRDEFKPLFTWPLSKQYT